ncbi:MAG: transglutaminase domain-containing protein [Planctomycetales bacterium]|nr:transglutaminase domain-containing protein [Planctomycetales bacterium]
MKRIAGVGVLVFVMIFRGAAGAAEPKTEPVKERKFQLIYAAKILDAPEGAEVRVWIPVPPSTGEQSVTPLSAKLPAKGTEGIEERFGSKMLSFELTAPKTGEIAFSTSYQVARKEVHGLPPEKMGMKPVKLTDEQRKLLLSADARVPIDGKPLELLAGRELPAEQLKLARLLYDRVDEHVNYDKSKPGYGRGDVLWVCDSRFGNCTDFHSLFISLARAKGLPARFEIGFSVPEKRGEGLIAGYHCWAFFWLEKQGWVPVDISEADKNPAMKEYYFGNLTENRVTFSQGRDLTLDPKQVGEPLNFFIYPYVEVDGKAWPAEKVKLEVSYKDE